MDVGATIRTRRQQLGLTLEVLARGSGVSRAMLSDVERGAKSPTVKTLSLIAVGLGCRMADLLEDAEPAALAVERADERAVITDEITGVERHTLASPLLTRGLELVWYVLPPGTTMVRDPEAVWYVRDRRSGPFPPNPAGTVEHVVVLAGAVELHQGGQAETLRVGDCVNYRLVEGVTLVNASRRPVRLGLVLDTHDMRRSRAC